MELKKIILVDHGLANSFDDRIEINKSLKKDPELFKYVLEHEKRHTNDLFSLKDYWNDFRINFKLVFRLIFFILRNPKTLSDLIPIRKINNERVYDINMIISYLILLTIIISVSIWIF